MSFLFGKKPSMVTAIAELIGDGRAIWNEELKKPKYNNYSGGEPQIEVDVRVEPANEPPFEAKMKAGFTVAYLLKPGVRVMVKYDPNKKQHVTIDEQNKAVLERNPQLIKKE